MNQIPKEGEYCYGEDFGCPCLTHYTGSYIPHCGVWPEMQLQIDTWDGRHLRLPQCLEDRPKIVVEEKPLKGDFTEEDFEVYYPDLEERP